MPKIEVEGHGAFEVADTTRLVNALETHGVDILHRCGGYAKCTTCRVEFVAGEPERITQAEQDKLAEKNLLGQVRLACQILCDQDMSVRPLMTLGSSGLPDPGSTPEAEITPPPVWISTTTA
jgi:ferredoxin